MNNKSSIGLRMYFPLSGRAAILPLTLEALEKIVEIYRNHGTDSELSVQLQETLERAQKWEKEDSGTEE